MRNLYLILVFCLISYTSFADNTLIPYGQANAGAPQWKYKGGGTNLDGVAWKDLAYAEPGWLTGSSALGFGNQPPPFNTEFPENNTAGGAGASGSRYPTLYFRKLINIADPNLYTGFIINAKFDDAIVVYINGTEVLRNNIGANPAYATWATSAISGNGSNAVSASFARSLMNAGDNIIAVEIHQNAANSSDMFFDLELIGSTTFPTVTRGAYLQMGNQTEITVRWRTDIPSDSRVTWGTSLGSYPNIIDSTTETTEHIVKISGLSPDTKYYYTIGASYGVIQTGASNYFQTAPPSTATRKLKFAAFGDCGNGSTNQVDTKNALISYLGSNDLDGWILLGDNAYYTGLETEFQTGFFNIYNDNLLRNKKLYPAPGNHDYGSSANTGLRNIPYYNNFSLPSAGECGGVASGTEAYYSFDIGDVHFVSLDSYGREDANTTKMYDTSGAQTNWLKNDLAANTKRWTVVYFHHPPYTKTSHTSDTEVDLIAIRERFIRILERYGVDLVICGHSHGYERSYLLKNYYKATAAGADLMDSDFNAAAHTATGNRQNGKYDGTDSSCAYTYNSGKYNHGSIYIVAGSSGQVGGSTTGYPHDAMAFSNNTNGGSLYFEVDSNRLDAKFISYTGTGGSMVVNVRDQFSIFKDVKKVKDTVVAVNAALNLSASWRGSYVWPSNGSSNQSITVNTSIPGSYDYVVTDANNCLKDSFHVIVTGALAAQLSDFTATAMKTGVALNWKTSREINNHHFTVEKSLDGNNFNTLGSVAAAGTSTALNNYKMNDYQPAEGNNFYRLSQTDIDGNKKELGIRKVVFSSGKDFQTAISYHGQGKLELIINSKSSGQVIVKVMDLLGKEIQQMTYNVAGGSNKKAINLKNGAYIISFNHSNGSRSANKVIIE